MPPIQVVFRLRKLPAGSATAVWAGSVTGSRGEADEAFVGSGAWAAWGTVMPGADTASRTGSGIAVGSAFFSGAGLTFVGATTVSGAGGAGTDAAARGGGEEAAWDGGTAAFGEGKGD